MKTHRFGFSLVELLVVIFVIGVLVAILIPALAAARTRTKVAATQAEFSALEAGIEAFRGEAALGGDLPPSRSDNAKPGDTQKISNPFSLTKVDNPDTVVNGAHLLAFAMVGADQLGPPGFKDFDNDGFWSDDTHAFPGSKNEPPGAYGLDDKTGQTKRPRYGGGEGFVNDSARQKINTLQELTNKGVIQDDIGLIPDLTRKLPLFVDAFDRPILYYRALPSASTMCGDDKANPFQRGVYAQEDNSLITGTNGSKELPNQPGLDFGSGFLVDDNQLKHRIGRAVYPKALASKDDLTQPKFDNTFARFIWNRSVTVRNEPVRKDSYLLISAGPDGVYGSEDDVTNWSREETSR